VEAALRRQPSALAPAHPARVDNYAAELPLTSKRPSSNHDAVSNQKQLKRLICYPQGTTIADGRTAFLAWAEKNAGDAKRMAELPVVGLVRALAKAYPCK